MLTLAPESAAGGEVANTNSKLPLVGAYGAVHSIRVGCLSWNCSYGTSVCPDGVSELVRCVTWLLPCPVHFLESAGCPGLSLGEENRSC